MGSDWARIAAVLLAVSDPAVAQGLPEKPARGTLITAAELEAAVARIDTGAVADSMLHLMSIGGEYNVGVSVVRRSQVNGRTSPDAIVHDAITEVYHIVEGRGILVTGGTVDHAIPLPATDPVVREVIGPSAVGKTISGGTRQQVAPGDVVIIPPHTAHGFAELQTSRVVYLLVRIDPQRVLTPKSP